MSEAGNLNASVDVDAINAALHGYTRLVRFDLAADAIDHRFDLILSLVNASGRRLTILCRDVQHLELNPTGDSFEQMARLQVEDMRTEQLGRVQFALEEQENETLFLHCGSIALGDY